MTEVDCSLIDVFLGANTYKGVIINIYETIYGDVIYRASGGAQCWTTMEEAWQEVQVGEDVYIETYPPDVGLDIYQNTVSLLFWFMYGAERHEFATLPECKDWIDAYVFPPKYLMSVHALAKTNYVSDEVAVNFTVNGVSKSTAYEDSLEAGSYQFLFPKQIVYDGFNCIAETNEFVVDHPQNDETRIEVLYVKEAPTPECYVNADCPTGYECQDGVCVYVAPPPPPWPVVKPVHAFSNIELFCNLFDQRKTRGYEAFTDIEVLLGGRLSYAVTYARGSDLWPQPWARIYWNDNLLLELQWNEAHGRGQGYTWTGEVDLPQIFDANDLTIEVVSAFGGTAGVTFDVWLTFGYSQEPAIDPYGNEIPNGDDWMRWLPWITVGGVGLLLLARGQPRVIVVGKT